jgi:phage-related protein
VSGFGGAVKLTGESEYRKALIRINQSLREVDSELKVVTSQYDKTDRSQEALSAQTEALAKKYEAQGQKVQVLGDKYKAMDAQVEKSKATHASLKTELDAETAKLQKIEAESGKTSDAYQEQAEIVNLVANEYKKSEASIEAQETALSKARTELNNAEAAYNNTGNTLRALSDEMEKSGDDADNLGKEVKDAGDKAESASSGGFTVLKGVLADLASSAIQAAMSGLRQLGGAVIDVGRQAIESYADYEQLVGGVETLFGAGGQTIEEYAASVGKTVDEIRGEYNQLTQAQATVMTNASEAYRTVGMSANEYMENVTSFSAALVSSLGGDTVQAAISADQALQDIADNANKMGSDIDSITQAYQGFARGQYTLLDNLKLGYGGTQAEMERLLADATAFSGVEYDINNLSDVYDAIHVIQTEMGITGTTAREAASTISGSTQMMSAAWQNILTGIADDNADFSSLVDNFIESVLTVADNLLPRIQTTIEGMGELASSLLEELVPQLIEMIPPLLESGLPILLNSVQSVISSILSVLPQVLPIISGLIPQICSSIISLLPQVLNAGIQILLSLISGISSAIPQLLGMLPSLISQVSSVILGNLGLIITTGIDLLIALIEGITEALPQLIDMLPEIIIQVSQTILDNLPLIIDAGIRLLTALISGILETLPSLLTLSTELPLRIAEYIRNNLPQILATGKQILRSLISGITSMVSTLKTKIVEVSNQIKDKFAELPSRIIDVGKDLVRGLWNGINDMTSWVISKIQGFGDSVLSGIRDFFGINSPSKLFEDEVGKYLAQGIGVGFADEMRDVSSEMQDALPTSFDVNPNVTGGGAFGGALDYSTLVNALADALTGVTVEMDDVTLGKFVRKTVTNAIYT